MLSPPPRSFHATGPVSRRLAPIVSALAGADADTRKKAIDDLRELVERGLTEAEGRVLLEAAGRALPRGQHADDDPCTALVAAAARSPKRSYVELVKGGFDRYSPDAKWHALNLLASMGSEVAATAFLELTAGYVRDPAARLLPAGRFAESPTLTKILFPAMLAFVGDQRFAWDILHLLWKYLDGGALRPAPQEPYVAALLERYAEAERRLRPLQRRDGLAWRWEEGYAEERSLAALALDLLGRFDEPAAQQVLRAATSYSDPRLKAFALLGLIGRGGLVAHEDIATVAADPEMRNTFFDALARLGRERLFPAAWRRQEAFAESEMVAWLIFPTELGRAPDEIELMKVLPVPSEAGPASAYLFRFRTLEPHWSAMDGWMAGLAGPFLDAEAPTTRSLGSTFSCFRAWDEMSADEHCRDITGIDDPA